MDHLSDFKLRVHVRVPVVVTDVLCNRALISKASQNKVGKTMNEKCWQWNLSPKQKSCSLKKSCDIYGSNSLGGRRSSRFCLLLAMWEKCGRSARVWGEKEQRKWRRMLRRLSYVQTEATTPSIGGATMLWAVASVCTWLKFWPVSNFAQQLPTTHNNMQQCVQTDPTCNIQQRCIRLKGAWGIQFN